MRFRPTYANVVSTLALFVALGGVGYAAATLPSNSVGTKQLKKDAVRSSDIKKSAVSTTKIKNGSLLEADFKSGQLPQGLKGDRGPQGPTGGPPPVQAWKVLGVLGQPTLQNGWINNNLAAYHSAAFFRDLSGVVHLRGVVSAGTGLIFSLPAGYFPPKNHRYVVSGVGGVPDPVQVEISATGGVATLGPATIVSLEGISFRATG